MSSLESSDPDLHDLVVRPMVPADIAAVHAIEETAYSHPWTVGIFADCLRAGYEGRLLVSTRGEIRAYMLWSWGIGEVHLLNLCVDPCWQGRGLGRYLLLACIDEIACCDCDRILLEVRESNLAAIELYRGLGFHRIGQRRDYYPAPQGGREDAWVMALERAALQALARR